MKKKQLKYLSDSVLLEEAGLPRLNLWIMILVFLMVVSFIVWASWMRVDEIIGIKGAVTFTQDSKIEFVAYVPINHIGRVNEGDRVTMTIVGINDNLPIKAAMGRIEAEPVSVSENLYFMATVIPTQENPEFKKYESLLLPGMQSQLKIVVGSQSLLEYILGPVVKIQKNAFK